MPMVHLLDAIGLEPFCGTSIDEDRWTWTISPDAMTCPSCARAIREERDAALRWAAQEALVRPPVDAPLAAVDASLAA